MRWFIMELNTSNIKELCPGEVRDFMLELVRKERRNLPPDVFSRRKELCDALLANNAEIGNRQRMKDTLINILKQWKARKDQISQLVKAGFDVTKGKTHYKIRIQNSGYFLSLAATPGDHRTGTNATTNALLIFF